MPGIMMLSRDLKRVPLDFDWPLNERWSGYVDSPDRDWPRCERCGGDGSTPEARAIAETFYEHQIGGPAAGALAWHDKIGQAEVDNLVAKGRLRKLVEREPTDDDPRAWEWVSVPRTAAEVNAANRRGSMLHDLNHDGINRWILIRFRCERLGIEDTCSNCGGHGDIASDAEREAAEEWVPTEPPTGVGFQLWESVSEGSPVSPVFCDAESLAAWLSANDTSILAGKSAKEWRAILSGEVFGTDLHNGELVRGR